MRAFRVGIVLSAVITDEHVFGQKSDRIEIQNTLPLVPKRADIWKVGSPGPSRCWMTRRKRRFGEVVGLPSMHLFFLTKKKIRNAQLCNPICITKMVSSSLPGDPLGM